MHRRLIATANSDAQENAKQTRPSLCIEHCASSKVQHTHTHTHVHSSNRCSKTTCRAGKPRALPNTFYANSVGQSNSSYCVTTASPKINSTQSHHHLAVEALLDHVDVQENRARKDHACKEGSRISIQKIALWTIRKNGNWATMAHCVSEKE